MRIVLLLAALSGLVSFAWARRSYFVRPRETPPSRNGLGPLGTILGLVLVALLAFAEPPQGGVQSVASLALFVGSQALFWQTLRAFGSRRPSIAFAPGTPDALVTVGPYRYVRHPFYLSYSLFWLAGAVAVPYWPMIVGSLGMLTLYYRAAAQEEQTIARSGLGAEYEAYKRTTGMFLPRIFR
jgi:protein-S-isoprenylcysteine O-methyltransferase Ste14